MNGDMVINHRFYSTAEYIGTAEYTGTAGYTGTVGVSSTQTYPQCQKHVHLKVRNTIG